MEGIVGNLKEIDSIIGKTQDVSPLCQTYVPYVVSAYWCPVSRLEGNDVELVSIKASKASLCSQPK